MTVSIVDDRPLVVVTVGSDHHRFDRLVEWVDAWCAERDGQVSCVVQHGPARPPNHAQGVDYLEHSELQRLMARADVLVCQGGPMSVVEARQHGRLPIVVPRTAALDEVVDDHQHAFCRRMAERGTLRLADSAEDLAAAMDAALAYPEAYQVRVDPDHADAVAAAVDQVGRIADDLSAQTPGRGPAVLLLGGFGRSGTTLLERCLGQVPDVVPLGEVLHLWERGHRDDELCGCGLPFSACDFWQRVGKQAYGGWTQVEPTSAVDDRTDVVRNRRLPMLLARTASPARRLRRNRLLRRLDALYRSATAVGDARLLVDSSKHPAYAYLLRRASVRLRCVLVVRDPRGVAYSWSKKVLRPEVVDGTASMPRYGMLSSAVRWTMYNFLFHLLPLAGVPVRVVRYEDLVTHPRETVARVLQFAGVEPDAAELSHIGIDSVKLGTDHTVAGNPMRFQVGTVQLRPDEEWRKRMPVQQQRTVGMVTTLARWAYGYWT